MKKRFITGIFIAAFFAAVILLTLWAKLDIVFDIFVLILMVGGAIEMCKAVAKNGKPYLPLIIVAIAVGYGAFRVTEYYAEGFGFLAFTAVLPLVYFAALIISAIKVKKQEKPTDDNALITEESVYDKIKENKSDLWNRVCTTVFVFIYPVTVLAFSLMLNYLSSSAARACAILLLFLVAAFTDVFAYLVGSTLKGPKLCPKISPKKTVSGAIGGLLGGIIAGLIVFVLAKTGAGDFLGVELFAAKLNEVHFIAIGLLGSVATQAGDLAASFVKRRVGVKDYGTLLPGHGGVMDRVDGLMFNAVVLYMYLLIF